MPYSKGVNIFREIFNQKAVDRILKKATDENGLRVLYDILTSSHKSRTAQRKYLNKWLHFAKDGNGLDKDRLSRLRKPRDYHVWQSVVHEIKVAYFFAKAFNHKIRFVTDSSVQGEGDFVITDKNEQIVVEVKTPYDPKHSHAESISGTCHGLDTHLIKKSFLQAVKQLKGGNANLVVICTYFLDRISGIPDAFIKYFFGDENICLDIDKRTGQAIGHSYPGFDPCGEFARHKGKQNTRISAIASFEEFLPEAQRFYFSLFFNIYASKPLDKNLFPNTEQFVLKNGLCSIDDEDEAKRIICLRD